MRRPLPGSSEEDTKPKQSVRLHWSRLQVLDPDAYRRLYSVTDMDGTPFATRALIEGLIAHAILQPGQVIQLWEALQTYGTVPAFKNRILETIYQEERVRDPQAVVRGKAAFLRHTRLACLAHVAMIRTVLVTPARLVISPPQQERSNSVTRRYADSIDGIIRVQFADEEDNLFVLDGTRESDKSQPHLGVMTRVRRALKHGIIVGGRTFLPVASSASQQKEHAIWFIDTKSIDGVALRKWMGSVDGTIVAKHAARMGLPFRTSRIVNLDIQLGCQLADIERNGYCFTDGIAIAGRAVMIEAAKALGYTRGINACPSAIQFRLGGAKGVPACWPGLELRDLNVSRLAKYQTAFLNRQFILIMIANGVQKQLILEVFDQAVTNIKGLGSRVREGRMSKQDRHLLTTTEFPVSSLIDAGFNNDPLVLDIVRLIECRTLQDLKWRARIRLEGGTFLIGIADEAGLLGENEVFCQIQESDDMQPKVVESECLICRAPALHPGDVRRCFAVDLPRLRHLKNVIVFITRGARDLPNVLGGGDLGGDDYTLIWDQRFVKPLVNYRPMDYTAPPPTRVPKVTQEHLHENFVRYVLRDVLGQVDYWHMAWSDHFSPFHEHSMTLSQKHSTAVDFAKSIPAELPPQLRPKVWPSFMDRDKNKKTYESEKILGKLFRLVQPDPSFRPGDLKREGYPVDPRLTRFQIFDSVLAALRPVKARYEGDIQFDMRRYRVTEPEIPAGFAIINRRRRRARDQNLNEPLRDSYEAHVKSAREDARSALTHVSFSGTLSLMQMAARHAYGLTFEKDHISRGEEDIRAGIRREDGLDEDEALRGIFDTRPITSFARVFSKELVEIVQLPKA